MNDSDLTELKSLWSANEFSQTVLPDGSSVVLDIAGHRVLTLSAAAVVLVDAVVQRGVDRMDRLVECLLEQYDVDPTTARRDAEFFLAAILSELSKAPNKPPE